MTRLRKIGDIAESFLQEVAERQALGGVEHFGIPTGFYKIDRHTGGMQEDQLWIIGARPSVGKTSLALDIGLNVARLDKGVLFYSLETRGEILVNRLLSRMCGIPAGRIIRGKISDAEFKQVKRSIEEFHAMRLGIIDSQLTTTELREHALSIADKGPVDLIMIDYASLFTDAVAGATEKMEHVSGQVRNLARPDQLNCPVVLLAQLNRASEMQDDPLPQLHHLKSSSRLEQDAAVVIFPHRPEMINRLKGVPPKEVETDAQLIIAKNKDGPIGATGAHFFPDKMMWEQQEPLPIEPKSVKGKTLKEQVQEKRAT